MADNTNTTTPRQRPALIIGLGGTGKQVLLNLRRMFYERYGKVTFPHVAHLWIDTDTKNVTLDGKSMDFLMQEVDFSEGEKIAVDLRAEDLRNFYDRPEAHPQIFSWFDRRLEQHGHIRDGAGGIRSFGRLAFFRHYERIMERLRERKAELERAVSHNLSQDQHGIALDAGEVDFWVIFSVAGGTGSGMFLDLAFALRDLWPNVHSQGVVVLPSVFTNNFGERVYGNAYAALMELEHYNFGKDISRGEKSSGLHKFRLGWTREMHERKRSLAGPVFDMVYLIGNRPAGNKGALSLDDKDALCRMIAESLYIEYGTGPDVIGLASERRSARVNNAAALNTAKRYSYKFEDLAFEESFTRRYSSFGLSKVHIPVSLTLAVTQHRLGRDFIDFWTSDRPIPASLDDMLERTFVHRIGVDNGQKNNNFLRALDASNDGDRLSNKLHRIIWGERREQVLGMVDSPNVRARINDWVETELLIGQLDSSSPMRDRWGALTKVIDQNQESHFRKITEGLHEMVAEILAQPEQRFDVAREALRRIRDRLLRDKDGFEKRQLNTRNVASRLMQEVQTRLSWLDDVTGRYTRRGVVEVALEDIDARVNKELQAQVLGSAAKLAERVIDYIGRGQKEVNAQGDEIVVDTGLIKQLSDFQQRLRSEVLKRFDDRIEALSKQRPSPIYQDVGEGDREADRFYVDPKGDPIVHSTLSDWEQRFFEDQAPSGPNSLWEMRLTIESHGTENVIDRLLNFAQRRMSYLENRMVNVLDRLAEKYKPGSSGYEAVLDNLLGYAQPWLSKPHHFVDQEDQSPVTRRQTWVALPDTAKAENRRRFLDSLGQRTDLKYQSLSTSADRVYAYNEMAGLPLMMIPDLDRYRSESYLPLLESGETLHTDVAFEKFQDLLIMEGTEVDEYVRALKVFLKAITLGIITTRQEVLTDEGDMVFFQFVTREGLFEKTIKLGPFSIAVRRLARQAERSLLDSVRNEVLGIENDLPSIDLVRWYVLLDFHGRSGDSFFRQFPENHVVRAVFRREAEVVRDHNPHVIDTAESELVNIKHWTAERPRQSGLYTLKVNR